MEPDPNSNPEATSSQPPEKETATGSGGLFGDLRHDEPEDGTTEEHSKLDTQHQSTAEPNLPARQEAVIQSGHHERQDVPADTLGSAHDPQHVEQPFPGPNADQPTTAGAESSSEQQPHVAEPSLNQQSSAMNVDVQQPALQSSASGWHQQSMTHATDHHHPQQQRQGDEHATQTEQQPPMEAQLAEEQDLVPDVGSTANRVARLQRLRKAIDRLTYKYVFWCRSSMTATLRLAATRQ